MNGLTLYGLLFSHIILKVAVLLLLLLSYMIQPQHTKNVSSIVFRRCEISNVILKFDKSGQQTELVSTFKYLGFPSDYGLVYCKKTETFLGGVIEIIPVFHFM